MIRLILLVPLILMTVGAFACSEDTKMNDKKTYNKLTAEEESIIVRKATEPPYSGKYNNFSEKGVYTCKRCDAELYRSDDKFNSRCGWPSFDDEIEGAIRREADADGHRTEILCAECGAHLGHVFEGERLTKKNVRHCVNSLSMNFVPAPPDDSLKTAYFAGGCFWGTEYFFQKLEAVDSAVSGYMGGYKEQPTYREVVAGNTGHYETVAVTYDPAKITYEELVKYFMEIHDPEQTNGQGPDIGEQYLSVIFYESPEEMKIAEKLIKILTDKGYRIATKLKEKSDFWKAEDYHQDYYEHKGQRPYCHAYTKRF